MNSVGAVCGGAVWGAGLLLSLSSMPAQYVSKRMQLPPLCCSFVSVSVRYILPTQPGPLAVAITTATATALCASESGDCWKIRLLGHDSVRLAAKRHKSNSASRCVFHFASAHCRYSCRQRTYLQKLVFQLLFATYATSTSCTPPPPPPPPSITHASPRCSVYFLQSLFNAFFCHVASTVAAQTPSQV